MQYIITRTSEPGTYLHNGEWEPTRPCDDPRLKLLPLPTWDRRITGGKDTQFPSGWFTRGSEHTSFPGGIARRLGTEAQYTIDFDTPTDMLLFIGKFPRVVILHEPPNLPTIEIYDDYHE